VAVSRIDMERVTVRNDLAAALDKAEFRTAVSKNDVAAARVVFDRLDLARVDLARAGVNDMLASAAVQKVLLERQDVAELVTLGRVEMRQSLDNAAFARVLESASFRQAMSNGDARAFVAER